MVKLFGCMFAIAFLLLVLVSDWHPLASVKGTFRESSGNEAAEALREQYIKGYVLTSDPERIAERRAHDVKRRAQRWKAIKESLKAVIPQRRAKSEEICRQQPEDRGSHIVVGMSGQIDLGPASTCADRPK